MAARSEITLGFVGSGKVEKRNATALLRDLIDASGGNARFILPMTKAFWNDNLAVVSDFAVENSIPVEAIVDDTTAKMREIKHLLSAARRQHQSAAAAFKMAGLLEEAKDGRLVVLWDDEDEDSLDAVRAADEKGLPLLELTRGLDRIELVADDEDEGEEPVSDEAPEEPEAREEEDDGTADEQEAEEPEEDEPDAEPEEEEEDFPEAEAEEDLPAAAEDEAPEEFPDDEAAFVAPAEEEKEPAVAALIASTPPELREHLAHLQATAGLSDFQARLVAVLTATAESLLAAVEMVTRTPTTIYTTGGGNLAGNVAVSFAAGMESKAAAEKALAEPVPDEEPAEEPVKPRRARSARKAPASKPEPEEAPGRPRRAAPKDDEEEPPRTVRRRTAAASSNGMSREEAKKIMDEYRPKRGRPPAEVMEARKVLGLA